jgi:hypothetical protein
MVQSWRALRVASLEPKPTVRWLLGRGMLQCLGHLPGKTFVALSLGDVEGMSLAVFLEKLTSGSTAGMNI